MELTCLNCAGTFRIKGDEAGGTVKCPICGQEQPFVGGGDEDVAVPDAPPVGDATPVEQGNAGMTAVQRPRKASGAGVGFRKPMQAFSGLMHRQVDPKYAVEVTTSQMKKIQRGDTPAGHEDLPLDAQEPKDGGNRDSGLWLVRSPTGLVLEFPSSDLLVNWSSVLENTSPYRVSKGGADWTPMEDFLRRIREGSRGTSAVRRVRSSGEGREGKQDGEGSAPSRVEGGGEPRDIAGGTPHPTSQFQFKMVETKEPKVRKGFLVAVLVGVMLLLAGIGTALYLTGIVGF